VFHCPRRIYGVCLNSCFGFCLAYHSQTVVSFFISVQYCNIVFDLLLYACVFSNWINQWINGSSNFTFSSAYECVLICWFLFQVQQLYIDKVVHFNCICKEARTKRIIKSRKHLSHEKVLRYRHAISKSKNLRNLYFRVTGINMTTLKIKL
jgi:hypothetical protein